MGTDFNIKLAGAPAIEPANDAIVVQTADAGDRVVPQLFSDGAVLRRRSYFRARDLATRAPTRMTVTDRMV